MKTDEQKRRDLSAFLYRAKRAIEDHKRRQMSDRQFAAIIGMTPASLSKYLNAAVMPLEDKIDIMAGQLDREFAKEGIENFAMEIYEAVDLPPRVSTQDPRLIEIVHLWNRLTPEQRAELHEQITEQIREVA